MEEEAREILRRAIGGVIAPKNLGQAIHARFAAIGCVELELPARGPMREPPLLARRGDSSSFTNGPCNLVFAASTVDGDAPAEDEVRN
ncbi:hypothetical protein [Methylosinus sp. PW1]|uniref:hypothetical protein n=1 Tax=Methylosinus sp. PW1 TaxID=107636 RepID=UPI000A656711